VWCALAEQAGNDGAIRLGYAPHVTLAILPDVAPAAIEAATFRAAAGWDALPLTLAGLGVFPGTPPVVWAAPVVTERLLARQAALCAALAPLPVQPHYRPGACAPHVTLSRSGPASATRIIEVASAVWVGPIGGRLEWIELVRFRPVELLRTQPLHSAP
jgi:2'-5' RNA ligase